MRKAGWLPLAGCVALLCAGCAGQPTVTQTTPTDSGSDITQMEHDAAAGDAEAQYALGEKYLSGDGVTTDTAKGVALVREAAAQNLDVAQYSLGFLYAQGTAIAKDDAQAAHWFELAANQGVQEAEYQLGNDYYSGTGVPADPVKAEAWLSVVEKDDGDTRALPALQDLDTRLSTQQKTAADALAQQIAKTLAAEQKNP